MSVIAPKEKDDIETQFDHSQIYLYEMEANKQPVKRPRHCLPYAVITWLKSSDGPEWPVNFNNDIETPANHHSETNGGTNGHITNGDHDATLQKIADLKQNWVI